MKEFTPAPQSIPHQAIARRAYEMFLAEGCPVGRELEQWLQAERELAEAAVQAASQGAMTQTLKTPTRTSRRRATQSPGATRHV